MKESKRNKQNQKKKSASTRKFLNIKTITERGIELLNGDEIIFYFIQPQNLSVMSKENISAKVFALTNVLKGLAEVEILCMNSRDNFEENKIYLKKRIEEEDDEKIIELLKKDLNHLDSIQMESVTARLFLLCVRVKQNDKVEVMQLVHRIEKLIKLQNITVKRASREDIKEMLAVYFEQNVTNKSFEDRDGMRWYDNDVFE